MISFACNKCGKRHSRPDGQAGTLVFCDCGQSVRVPWAAEVAEPAPAPRPAPRPVLDAEPAPPPPAPSQLPVPSRRPGRLLGKVNPNFCFQHDDDPSEVSCAACRLPFCNRCVVTLEAQALCGPCKNFRLARLGRPRRTLPLAVVALVVSLSSGPVALILSLGAAGLYQGEGFLAVSLALCLIGLILPVTGVALSGLALHRLDARPQSGGRGLAASGACAAMAGVVWCVTVAFLLIGKHVLG
jgi:hypothetical protein